LGNSPPLVLNSILASISCVEAESLLKAGAMFPPLSMKAIYEPKTCEKYFLVGFGSFRSAFRFNKWSDIAHDFIPVSPN